MEMNKTLQDKVAIVTGGAQGLGNAISVRLAKEGCKVVIADINQEGIRETENQIHELFGSETMGIITDVSKDADVEHLVNQTVKQFGRLDIMVSNAGILIAQPIEDFPSEKWMKVMAVNLFGYFLCCKHAGRVMKQQRSGTIIQINSKSGKKGSYKNSAYAASKFGGVVSHSPSLSN